MLFACLSVFGAFAGECVDVSGGVGGEVSQEYFPAEGAVVRGDAVPGEFAEVSEGDYGGG